MARKNHLINVHTGTGTTAPTNASLYLGEIAVQHTPENPALWIKMGSSESSTDYEKFIGETEIHNELKKTNHNIPYVVQSGDTYTGSTSQYVAECDELTGLTEGQSIIFHPNQGSVSSNTDFASSCTLNIKLADGTMTGPKRIYLKTSAKVTTQISGCTDIKLTYHENITYSATTGLSGWWVDFYYDTDKNTDVRAHNLYYGNSQRTITGNTLGRYRLLLSSADENHWVPINTSTATTSGAAKTITSVPIDPFGPIAYYSTSTTVATGSYPGASVTNTKISAITIGFSFVVSLTAREPVFLKCTPQADGSAIIDSTTPFVQSLPSTEDGKIYIFLGVAAGAITFELYENHPVYEYKNGHVRLYQDDNGTDLRALSGAVEDHIASAASHVSDSDRTTWNGKQDAIDDLATIRARSNSGYSAYTGFIAHSANTDIHVTSADKTNWTNSGTSGANAYVGYIAHSANTDIHVTASDKETWNGKQDAIDDLAAIRNGANSGASAWTAVTALSAATTGISKSLNDLSAVTITGVSMNGSEVTVADHVATLGDVVTDVISAGTGNAFTSLALSDGQLTLTKGSTFLTTAATTTQGGYADNALQVVCGSTYITTNAKSGSNGKKIQTITAKQQAVSTASATGQGLADAYDVKQYVDGIVTSTVNYKGATATLPSTSTVGDMYIATDDIALSASQSATGAAQTAETGDFIIARESGKWDVIQKNLDGAVTGNLTGDTLTLGDGLHSVKSLANGTEGQVLAISGTNNTPTWIDAVLTDTATTEEGHYTPTTSASTKGTTGSTKNFIKAIRLDSKNHVIDVVTGAVITAETKVSITNNAATDTASAVVNSVASGGTGGHALTISKTNKIFSASTADSAITSLSAATSISAETSVSAITSISAITSMSAITSISAVTSLSAETVMSAITSLSAETVMSAITSLSAETVMSAITSLSAETVVSATTSLSAQTAILGPAYTYSGIPYVNSATSVADAYSALTNEVIDDERVAAAALNDLNIRVSGLSGMVLVLSAAMEDVSVDMILGSGYTYSGISYINSATSIADAFSALTEEFLRDEEAIAEALNDLNTRDNELSEAVTRLSGSTASSIRSISNSVTSLSGQVSRLSTATTTNIHNISGAVMSLSAAMSAVSVDMILGSGYTYSGLPYINSATSIADAFSALTFELFRDEKIIGEAFNEQNNRIREISADTGAHISNSEIHVPTGGTSGQFLSIVNGSPAWVNPVSIMYGSGIPSSNQGNNGDIFIQTS